MFAFALWDAVQNRLTLARDRLGEKPLYLARADGLLAFASEVAALRAVPGIDWSLDRNVVADFLKRGYVSGAQSMFGSVEILPPATIATFDARESGRQERRRYWEPRPDSVDIPDDDDARADAVEALLLDSIRLRSFADVPVGAFLSGGIDSSLVVALMQEVCGGNVHTFSIGFDEPEMDEAPHARRIAEHLGTHHTEVYLSADDALAVVPLLSDIFSEPFADPSQIPTYLVSSVAKRDVTVCLSGDGGDELFAGYDRYARTLELWRRIGAVPRSARRMAAAGVRRVSPSTWERSLRGPYRLARGRTAPADLGHKVRRLGEVLGGDGVGAIYDDLFSLWPAAHLLVPGAREPEPIGGHWEGEPATRWMTSVDLGAYLPDDILVKVDRASMAVSLEARVPMLDHRFVELALSLPDRDLLVDGIGKRILRRVLARHVPEPLFERPKMGFGAPIDRWLRGPLREWASDLLDPARLGEGDLLDPQPILTRWHEHQSGERNWQYSLWAVLMLQQWRERWCSTSLQLKGAR
jgi:asparagine synthase (glutamine-hydrolysing)